MKGKDGENLDAKNKRIPKKAESPSLFSDAPVSAPAPEAAAPVAEEEPAKTPKRRGRKSKAELAAIAAAEANIALNGYSKEDNPCYVADMKDYVTDMREGAFDLIILDPPAFAKRHQDRHRGLGGYKFINAEAIKRIAKGGLLFTFSCSQAVDKATFQGIVTAAAIEAKRNVRIIDQLSQPADHPINIFHPEGAYLKGLMLVVE